MNTKGTYTKKLILIAGLFLFAAAASLQAQSGTWTADASGNWSDTSKWLNGIVADGSGNTADFSTINITADRTVTLDANHTLTGLRFGDIVPDHNWILSGANTLTLAGTSPGINVVNQTATVSSVVAGTVGLTKTGAGTLDLSGADTLTGGVTVNGGTLTLDFTTGTTTVLGSQALGLGGGTLNILGANPGPSSQTFASTAFNSGANVINVAPTSGGSNPTLTLNAFSFAASSVQFVGPATINSSGNVAATATITTSAGGTGNVGQLISGAGAAYATVGLYDWASTDTTGGSAGTTLIGGSQVTGFYTALAGGGTVASSGKNYDVTGSTAFSSGGSTYTTDNLRFNTATATTFSVASAKNWQCEGILVTPTVGAHNVNFLTTGSGANGLNHNNSNPLSIIQNNTSAELIFNTTYYYNILGTGSYIQSGLGTVFLDGTAGNDYSGATYLNSGVTEIGPNSNGGAGGPAGQLGVGTGASLNVNLNGGTLIGDYTGNLDGASSTAHPVALGNNGGGLGAVTGTTLTVDGLVSGAAGTGALVIGIPASSANGSTVGQLPGTGTGTANTSVLATGTLILNNTGNTYTGGTIIDSGILQLTVNNLAVLGTGGLTLNSGTFQWNGVATDISSRTVTVASLGGTLDVDGTTVTLANSIGNGGSGALTVADSGSAGAALLLNGGSSHTGGTTVASGATLGGSGTLAGNVTWANGSFAKLTPGSPMTVSGTAAFNGTGSGNTITVNASGLTSSGSPYTLLTAGAVTGTVNPMPGGIGVIASGYNGVVSISGGNTVILTVTASGTAATWTDGDANQNWSDANNWSGDVVPKNAGDTATFNSAGGSAVTLDASETVGGITFNNASSDVISGGNTLTLDNSGSGVTVTVSAGTANAINTSVALNDNTAIIANSGELLTLGGTVANSSGSKTLTISGGGTAIISQANTYGPSAGSVGTTLGGATVQVGNNTALGSGDVSVTGSSTLQSGAAGLSIANNIAVASLQTATVDNNGNDLSLGGVISGGGALTKIGNGTLTLSGASTYSGGTTFSSGQLNVNNGGSGGTSSAIGAGTLTLGGGTLDNTSAGDVTLSPAIAQNWNGDFTYAGSAHNLNLGSGAVTLGETRQVTVSANTLTVGGVISGASYGLAKNGNGTLVLGGANTFGGTTTIANGTLQLANSSALQNSTLDYSSGTLDFGSLTAATLGGLSGTQAGQNLNLANDSSAAVTLTVGNNNATTIYGGQLSGTGASLTKTGTGALTLSNATYTGGTTVSLGYLTNIAGTFGSSSSTFAVQGTSASSQNAGATVGGGALNAGQVNIGIGGNQYGATLIINGTADATFATGVQIGASGDTAGGLIINTIGNVYLGAAVPVRDNGTGLTIQNGTVTAKSVDVSANSTSAAANSELKISGGSLTITNASGGLIIDDPGGNGNGHTATLTVSGGTLIYTNNSDGLLVVNSAATSPNTTGGYVNMIGGTTLLTGITLNKASYANATAILTVTNGATLYLGSAGLVLNGGANVAATFGTSTVGAITNWSSTAPITLTTDPIGGPTTFQTADASANPWNITLGGALSGTGALTKTGNGTLTLGGNNTYNGATSVSNGTLIVNGNDTSAGGAVTVTNATLGGIGTVGGATALQANTKLAPGDGVTANVPLTFSGTLTLDAATTNLFNVNNTAGGAVNKVAVTGALTPAGSVIHVVNSGTPLVPGAYALFTYGGGVAGPTFDATPVFDLGTAVHPGSSIVDNGSSQVSLVVPNQAPVVANIVTNNVTTGLSWKIAISDLKTAAGWSDPDGDAVTLSSVTSPSANGTNVTTDGTFIYYNGAVTAEDHFTYTVTDPYGATANGTVYLEAVAGTGPSISGPAPDDNGHPTFSGAGIPNYVYGVESSTTSVDGPWINAGTVTAGADGSWSFTDASQTHPTLIFYRLYYPYSADNPPQ